jgi:hypothetical protein
MCGGGSGRVVGGSGRAVLGKWRTKKMVEVFTDMELESFRMGIGGGVLYTNKFTVYR